MVLVKDVVYGFQALRVNVTHAAWDQQESNASELPDKIHCMGVEVQLSVLHIEQ